MHAKFYNRFKILTRWPFWPKYLHSAYTQCIDDLQKINYVPQFNRIGFKAMLCGTSGEMTSKTFCSFVLARNPQSMIIIIDLGDMQLIQSKKYLSENFPHARVCYIKADARNLPLIEGAVNYIETDVLFNFVDQTDIIRILSEWKHVLTHDGFITTRVVASDNQLRRAYDRFLFTLGNLVLDVKYHVHALCTIKENLQKAGLQFVHGGKMDLFQFKRFSIIKPMENE